MADEILSVRIDKHTKDRMKKHAHINWSAIVRKILAQELDKMHMIDRKRAMEAVKDMDRIRTSGVFDGGKTGAEIIREWRDKRR